MIVSFFKRQRAAFYGYILAAVLGIVALAQFSAVDPGYAKAFLIPDGTAAAYGCGITGIVLSLVMIVLAQPEGKKVWKIAQAVAAVAVSVLLIVMTCGMIYSGAYSAALALGSTLGDNSTLNAFLISVVFALVSAVVSIVSSYFSVAKERSADASAPADGR